MPNPQDYTTGWICATIQEHVAAQAFLDENHPLPEYDFPNDTNYYTLGRIGDHNVVIAALPKGEYGAVSAAVVTTHMLHSFPNIRVGLMVGIGGGVPSKKHDIRLGDIVVSTPVDGNGGVTQYDVGKIIQDQGFKNLGYLDKPPTILLTAVARLKAQYERNGHRLDEAIDGILKQKPRLQMNFKRPEPGTDRLI